MTKSRKKPRVNRKDLLARVQKAIAGWLTTQDPECVLNPRVLQDARALSRLQRGTVGGQQWVDVEAAVIAALFYWYRYHAQAAEDGLPDLDRAVRLLTLVDRFAPDAVPSFVRPYLPGGVHHADPLAARSGCRDLRNDGLLLFRQAQQTHDPSTFDRAVALLRRAVEAWPEDEERAEVLENLGACLRLRHELTGDHADIDEAVRWLRLANDGISARRKAMCRSELGVALRLQAKTGPAGITESIDVHRQAVAAATVDERPLCVMRLGVALGQRAKRTGDTADLNETIDLLREAAQARDGAALPALINLGERLAQRADQTGSTTDLDEAAVVLREAVRQRRDASALHHLGRVLCTRFLSTGTIADLDESIDLGREAVRRSQDAIERQEHQCALAGALRTRFEHRGDAADLDDAEQAIRDALGDAVQGDPDYAIERSVLGSILTQRYLSSGRADVIDEAIILLEDSVAGLDQRDGEYPAAIGNLASALDLRFEYTRDRASLDRAIELLRTTVRDLPPGHSRRGFQLANLGQALTTRFGHRGALADLNDAITAQRDAVRAFPTGHPNQVHARTELANALASRATYTGSSTDLGEAVLHYRQALEFLPRDHPGRPAPLHGLSTALRDLTRIGDEDHLEEALELSQQAVALVPASDRRRINLLFDIATLQLTKGAERRDLGDIDTALAALRDVISRLTDHRDPRRRNALTALALALIGKAGITQGEGEYDEAIDLLRDAMSSGSDDNQHAIGSLMGLGQALHHRFERTGDPADLAEAIGCFRSATGLRTEPAASRMDAARRWALAATATGDADLIVAGWAAAVELVPLVAWRGLDRDDQEQQLAGMLGMTSYAAAAVLAAGRPEQAAEMLEHGRGVLWSQALDLRADLADVRVTDPELADRLDHIRGEFDTRLEPVSAVSLEDATFAARRHRDDQRMRMAQEWDDVVARIRQLPAHADFLRQPALTAMQAALPVGTVVVVNVSVLRCDAFCVSDDSLRVLSLPELSLADAVERGNRLLRAVGKLTAGSARLTDFVDLQTILSEVLHWLWRTTARPVLDYLGHSRCAHPTERIWWCPTGPLAMLPLHAAGHHEPAASRDSVLDRVISSYTPTVRALTLSSPPVQTRPTNTELLIVSVPNAPGQVRLPGASHEASALAHDFGEISTLLQDSRATHTEVLAKLATHPAVHFACHGRQDPIDPSAGALLLYDRPLTVLDIAEMHLPHGELAFLSACDTALGGILLPDENIHLAASLRQVGYRHVVGTLWPIMDNTGSDAATAMYARLLRGGRLDTTNTAEALHLSVRQMRDREPFIPSSWVPYLHFGP